MKVYKSAFELIADDKSQVKLYKLKSELMNAINDQIDNLKLTQTQASKIMKVTQARVSNVYTGHISKFTYDILFLMHDRIASAHNKEVNNSLQDDKRWKGTAIKPLKYANILIFCGELEETCAGYCDDNEGFLIVVGLEYLKPDDSPFYISADLVTKWRYM